MCSCFTCNFVEYCLNSISLKYITIVSCIFTTTLFTMISSIEEVPWRSFDNIFVLIYSFSLREERGR